MMLTFLTAAALASGTASPPPPKPPTVDLASVPSSARLQPPSGDKPHPAVAYLLTDKDVVAPGGTVRAGVLLVQDPGWHTYWKSPGDIGTSTQIAWNLPDGVEAGPYAFPVPQRFELEGMVSFGYDDRVLFYSTIAVPEDASGSIDLGASLNWLVCQESCIPGKGAVSRPVVVGAEVGPNAFAPLFDHYAAQHPVTSDAIVAKAVVDPASLVANKPFSLTVTVEPAPGHTFGPLPTEGTWPAFTPILPGEAFAVPGSIAALPSGGFTAKVTGDVLEADPVPEVSEIGGLVQVMVDGKPVATEIVVNVPWTAAAEAPPGEVAPTIAADGGPTVAGGAQAAPLSFGWSLVGAFFGGLLLNVMPCVLPVITLKLYGLVQGGHHGPAEQKKAGLAYTAGVLASFFVLAMVVQAIRSTAGAQIGWGFQFQSPAYVAALGAIVFGFGLSLFGVFEIPVMGVNAASEASAKEGHAGHFFAGVFATLLGAPCSAPFLAPAVGYAFAQPDFATIALFFGTIGLGLALPFLVVAFVPALFALMPQPGPWMETFRKAMAFTLIATAVWLADVFTGLVGPDAGSGYLWFLLTLGIGAFVFGTWGGVGETHGRQALAGAVGLAITGLGGWWFVDLRMPEAEAACAAPAQVEGLDFSHEIPWQAFSEDNVAKTAGKTVFIDFTAKWCLTCKVTEKTVIETSAVREAMRDLDVVPMKADWTRYDPVITEWLARHGRAGVPFWLVLPADRSRPEIVLPDAMTQGMLIEALKQGANR